jgi:hypothetical protein
MATVFEPKLSSGPVGRFTGFTMKQLPLTPEIEEIARRVVWFEERQAALANTSRFIAYAMTYGCYADVVEIQKHLSDDDLRAALESGPGGRF